MLLLGKARSLCLSSDGFSVEGGSAFVLAGEGSLSLKSLRTHPAVLPGSCNKVAYDL